MQLKRLELREERVEVDVFHAVDVAARLSCV
jgi:hypothetical protein